MDKIEVSVDYALKRVDTFVDIMRWVWTANLIIVIAAILTKKFIPLAIAAPTSVLSLVATAYARRAANYLKDAKQALFSESASSRQTLRKAA